jgi:hypothetical protein
MEPHSISLIFVSEYRPNDARGLISFLPLNQCFHGYLITSTPPTITCGMGCFAQLLVFNLGTCRDANAQPLGHTGRLLRLAAWVCVHVPIEVSYSCQGADQTFATQTQYCRDTPWNVAANFPLRPTAIYHFLWW